MLAPSSLLLMVVMMPAACVARIVFNYTEGDEFEIYVHGVRMFHHTTDSPMMFMGKGETNFTESNGNFEIDDRITARLPLTSLVVYSEEDPLDLELYLDYYSYVRFQVFEDNDTDAIITISEVPGDIDRLWLRVLAEDGERVYGGGAQFTYFNLRGKVFPMWAQEPGIGRNKSTLTTFFADQMSNGGGDYHTTSFPQPSYVSTRNYYFMLDGSGFSSFDFSNDDFHEIFVLDGNGIPGTRMRFVLEDDLPAVLGRLTDYLGRQPPLPEWIHSGAILGTHGGKKRVQGHLRQAEDYLISVSAMWVLDWSGVTTTRYGDIPKWDWTWSRDLYPGLPALVNDFANSGVRLLAYVNPYLEQGGRLFAEAQEQGYLVKNSSGQTYLGKYYYYTYGSVDLTNPAAFTWYKNEVIKGMMNVGFSGWLADMGEFLPVDNVVVHSGQSAVELHNQWPLLWARLNREAVEEAGKLGEVVFWMRAGFSGVANYSLLMSAGEQNVDWSTSDGLASTVTAALSMGMSGAALTHYDIGGFTTLSAITPPLVRTEELLLRSAEMAVFTPVFKVDEGLEPAANVQYYSSRGTLLKFARLSRMFATMKPYTSHVVNASSVTGLPAQRPLCLSHSQDTPTNSERYQYMYGGDILVAPVVVEGVDSWPVYLPSDPEASWVFLWDESITSSGGETLTVPAPLGQPPVFFRNTSAFVDHFRRVASETLVDAPPYLPEDPAEKPGDVTNAPKGAEGLPPVCNGRDVQTKCCFTAMLVVVLTVLKNIYN